VARLSTEEILERRIEVLRLLLEGVPRRAIPDLVDASRKAVGRDIAALQDAVGWDEDGVREALERTLDALRLSGRLEQVDEAKLAALRSMANQLDLDTTNSMMFRVYWDALEALVSDGDDGGELDRLAQRLFANPRDPS